MSAEGIRISPSVVRQQSNGRTDFVGASNSCNRFQLYHFSRYRSVCQNQLSATKGAKGQDRRGRLTVLNGKRLCSISFYYTNIVSKFVREGGGGDFKTDVLYNEDDAKG